MRPKWRRGAREYFEPYHALLAAEIERVRSRHGYAILLDGHSIRSRRAALFRGAPARSQSRHGGRRELRAERAELRGARCSPAPTDFSSVVNGRFKGGYVTRHYGAPARGVHALQLETAQACYMDEAPPYPWDASARGARSVALLRRLVAALAAVRPAA